jgi:ribosomal protein S27E
MEFDLLHPNPAIEAKKHKLKKLVQKPNSYFIDIKCKCKKVNHTFTHAQSIIRCKGCNEVIATPTGGKLKIKDGNQIRKAIE